MLNAFTGSPSEISQYSCHVQSGGGGGGGGEEDFMPKGQLQDEVPISTASKV